MRIEEIVINIIFDAASGSASVRSREGIMGQRFGALPQPTRSGYAFVGWYLGDQPVTEDTVIASDHDIRLVAHWEKKTGERRRTMLRRQRIAALALAVVIAALSVALAIAHVRVGVYTLKDTYVNESGETVTDKYTVKQEKATGLYALYNKQGEKMKVADDNDFNNYTTKAGVQYLVYVAAGSGNQYRVNTSTGEWETYAVVDTEGDETLGGTVINTRVMMFPQIKQEDVYSIEVTNETGTYRTYCRKVPNTEENAKTPYTSAVTVSIRNGDSWMDAIATYDSKTYVSLYDRETYAYLCSACGYTLTRRKLDLSDPAAPRLPDGSINYAAYGLAVVTDDEGNVDYTQSPAVYTIKKGEKADDGSMIETDVSYTVYVGDAIVSGDGYYVKRADRASVYIVSSNIANTVLQPAERMITPAVIYPMSMATYPMVSNFAFGRVDTIDPPEGEKSHVKLITEFSYEDLTVRENTIYSISPYIIPEGSETELLRGYAINSNSVDSVLYSLYGMKFLACKKFSPGLEDLRKYGLVDDVFLLSFLYNRAVASGGSGSDVTSRLIIGSQSVSDEALGQNVCYIYSFLYDMIVAVDPYYVEFTRWSQSRWYDDSYFQNNIAYLRELHCTFRDRDNGTERSFDFLFDNTASDQTNGPNSDYLKITCPQYEGNTDHVLDYTIGEDQLTDTGKIKHTDYTAIDNFRRFFSRLLHCSIEDDVDAAEFRADKGMTVEEFIASDVNDDKADAVISYRVEDYATIANTAVDSDGNRIWTENNKVDAVIRYYEYGSSGLKCLLTIEIIDNYDADGNPISDATAAHGIFYVSAASVGSLAGYAEDLIREKLIPRVQF